MSQEINAFKSEARRLHKHLANVYPGFTYSQSMEATAALHGASDWRTLIAQTEPVGLPAPGMLASEAFFEDSDQDGVIHFSGMSKAEMFCQGEHEYRYMVCEGWSHIFGVGMPDTTVRFVYDMVESKITVMAILSRQGWVEASSAQMADVEDSLKNANEEAFENPEDYGCSIVDDLPEWAQGSESSSQDSAPATGASKARFIVGELEYADLIPGSGNGVKIRFVFERETEAVVALHYVSSAQNQWEQAPDIMAQKVEEHFRSHNLGGLENPKLEGLGESNELPYWARMSERRPASPSSAPDTSAGEARYVYGEWDHDYNGMGRPLRIRFVFDRTENRLIRLQDKNDGVWEESSSAVFFSVQNILLGDEDYAIADPEGNDLVTSDELPPWAR